MRTEMSEMLHSVGEKNKSRKLHAVFSRQGTAYRLLLLIWFAVLLSACNGNDTASNSNAPVISNPPQTSLPMPPLNGKSMTSMGWNLADGKRSAFSDYNGKVLVLDFYATWCEPCRRSTPHLVELQKRYENDVRVIGLNVGGPDDVGEVPAYAREFQIQYQLGIPDDELASFLLSGSDAIPQTFIFDRNGKLLKNFLGFSETTGDEIDKVVESALGAKAD
jgi:thiol-disulfide isomerase/thioredoxin